MDIVTLAASRKYTDKKIMESGAVGIKYEIVDSLPSSGKAQTIYFVKNDSSSTNDYYDEYVWISSSSAFEKIGSTQIDGSATQPDWNQNDDTQPDYIKNRPFYTGDSVETVLIEETTVAFENTNAGIMAARFQSTFEATVGETYKVHWDGIVYECTCVNVNDVMVIGNLSIPGVGADSGEPFVIAVENGSGIIIYTADTADSHTISIDATVTPVVKINPKYIRDMYYTADPVETVFVEESVVTFEDTGRGFYEVSFESTFVPTVGETYKVSWDGSVYESTCLEFSNTLIIGNLSITGDGSDTGEPFCIGIVNVGRIKIVTQNTSSSHTISISGWTTQVVKIDEKYLPDTVATKSDVEAAQTTANNAQTTANNNREVLNGTFNSVATFTFDKQTSGKDTFVFNAFKYYKISDFNPAPDDVISFTGTSESGGDFSTITTGNNCSEYGLFIVVASAGDCSIPITETTTFSFTASSAGLYARYEKGRPYITAGTGEFTLRWPIEILLRSSQSYNTKQFKMVIDDSGIIKIINTSDGTEAQLTQTDEHINELINTALSKIGVAEEGAY